MSFARAMFVGLLALGAVNAQMASPSQANSHTWLTKAIANEEADLAARKAALLYLSSHPGAAAKAQQDAAVWLSAWQPAKDHMLDMSKLSVTEMLTQEIKTEEADLLARRAALQELKIKGDNNGNMTLESLLEDDIEEQEEANQSRKAALEYLMQHPDKVTEAERLRDQVLQRLVAEGDMTAENMEKGMNMGIIEAVNASVIEGERQVKSMRYALEILQQSAPAEPTEGGGEMATQQFGRDGFGDRGGFGDRDGFGRGRDNDDFGRGRGRGRGRDDRDFDDDRRGRGRGRGRDFDDDFGRGGGRWGRGGY